jgi:GT2 family glycosyltransferase
MTRCYSVIIAGYKDTSRQTLEGVLRQRTAPEVTFDVIMLDNTPDSRHADMVTDCFDSIVSEASRKLYVPHRIPGKSATQNKGIEQAQGTHCIFLDDDVLPEPDLVLRYDEAFQAHACAAVQGRVELMFVDGATPPAWLNNRFRLDLAEMDFGDAIIPFTMGLTGASMAFRADVFETHGPFDERFGPARTGTLEDQEFSERIRAAGEVQLFWPGASVRHMIPPERLTVKSFAGIYFDVGFSDYLLSGHLVRGGPCKFAFYSLRKASAKALKAMWCLVRGRRADAIHAYCEIHGVYAYWKQALLQSRVMPPS